MTTKNLAELRRKAEKIIKEKKRFEPEIYYQDIEKLVEELSIHQIELEMQNIELAETSKQLEKEKNKYKNLYNEAPIPYLTLNETGNIYDINNAAAVLFDASMQAFHYNSIFPYLDEFSKQKFVRLFKLAFESAKIEFGEIDFISKSGKIIHTKINAHVYYDDERKMNLCRCAITDITKNKKLENKLKRREQRFKTIFDEDSTINLLIEPQTGQILDANRAAKIFYKYRNLKSMKIQEINLLYKSEVEKKMKEAEKKHQNSFLFKHKIATGAIKDVEVYSTPMKIAGQNVLYSIILDITERLKTEKSLEKARNQLKFLNKSLRKLIEFDSLNDIYKFIVKSVHSVLPESIVFYMSINNTKNKAQFEALEGIHDSVFSEIIKTIGFNLIDKEFNLTEQFRKIYQTGLFITIE